MLEILQLEDNDLQLEGLGVLFPEGGGGHESCVDGFRSRCAVPGVKVPLSALRVLSHVGAQADT